MTYYFYTLCDPDTQEVRYVGVTTYSLRIRFQQHKSNAVKQKDQTHKTKWFRSLLNNGKLPVMNHIRTLECEDNSWEKLEKDLIKSYPNLTNHHVGGRGIVKGERLRTSNHNRIPIVKIHPWKDVIIDVYDSLTTAERALNSGKQTGTINRTVAGLSAHSFGFRWSRIDPLKFSKPLPYFFVYINNKFYKDYPSKQQLIEDLRVLTNDPDANITITKTIPPVSTISE